MVILCFGINLNIFFVLVWFGLLVELSLKNKGIKSKNKKMKSKETDKTQQKKKKQKQILIKLMKLSKRNYAVMESLDYGLKESLFLFSRKSIRRLKELYYILFMKNDQK